MKSYKNIFIKKKNKTKSNKKNGSGYYSGNNNMISNQPIDSIDYIETNISSMAEQPENFNNTYVDIPNNNNSLEQSMIEFHFQKLKRIVNDFHSTSLWSHFSSRQVLKGAKSYTSPLYRLHSDIKRNICAKVGRIPTGDDQKINSLGCTRNSKLEAAESKKQYFLFKLNELSLNLMLLSNKYKFETLNLLKSLSNEILEDIVIYHIFILNPHLTKYYKDKVKKKIKQPGILLDLKQCTLKKIPEIFCALKYKTIYLQSNQISVLPELFHNMLVKDIYLSYNKFNTDYIKEFMENKPENINYYF